MSVEAELNKISVEISGVFTRAVTAGVSVSTCDPHLKQLFLEANAILQSHLGFGNLFSTKLHPALHASITYGHIGRPYVEVMAEGRAVIVAAMNHIAREPLLGSQAKVSNRPFYVDAGMIAALNALQHSNFDFSRLVQMCRELNVANDNGAFISVVVLVRAIIDHVPPVFGEKTFGAVANKMPRSIKASLLHLEDASRNIADSRLHQHIRMRESVPTPSEANFSQELAVLLGEVINAAK